MTEHINILPIQKQNEFTDESYTKILGMINQFDTWLRFYGEVSQDQYDFWATGVGQKSKLLYYKKPLLGTLLASPFVLMDAFTPAARKFFMHRQRFPMADAHFAMGYTYLYKATGNEEFYNRAVHFLEELLKQKCPGFENTGWGYPFDWMTNSGVIHKFTPLITNTPYGYEAFRDVYEIDGKEKWKNVMISVANHVADDYAEEKVDESSAASSYVPAAKIVGKIRLVVNASSYRAFTLMDAAHKIGDPRYSKAAAKNLNFVIKSQRDDGSWFYSADGTDPFIDHFHTCFVLKNLIKIHKLTPDNHLHSVIERGMNYYLNNLLNEKGLPKPFAMAQRLTVYKQELYDYAESLNLLLIFNGLKERTAGILKAQLSDLAENWQHKHGYFRTRKLLIGWNNVPYLRWGQAQLFRSLALWLYTIKMNTTRIK